MEKQEVDPKRVEIYNDKLYTAMRILSDRLQYHQQQIADAQDDFKARTDALKAEYPDVVTYMQETEANKKDK